MKVTKKAGKSEKKGQCHMGISKIVDQKSNPKSPAQKAMPGGSQAFSSLPYSHSHRLFQGICVGCAAAQRFTKCSEDFTVPILSVARLFRMGTVGESLAGGRGIRIRREKKGKEEEAVWRYAWGKWRNWGKWGNVEALILEGSGRTSRGQMEQEEYEGEGL